MPYDENGNWIEYQGELPALEEPPIPPEPPRQLIGTNMRNGVRQDEVVVREQTPEEIAQWDKMETGPMRTGVQANGTPWASNVVGFTPPGPKPDLVKEAGMPKLHNQQKAEDDRPTIPGPPPGSPGYADTARSQFERYARKQIADSLGDDPITMSVSQFKAKAFAEANDLTESRKTNLLVSPNWGNYNRRVNDFIERKKEGLAQLSYMMQQFDKDHERKVLAPGAAIAEGNKIVVQNPKEVVPKTPNEYGTFYASQKALGKSDAEIDKEWQNRKISVAEASQAKKDAGIDVPGLARAVADGQDAPMAIKGSMGNPLAAKVKSEVLKAYPKFNFEMADANYKWKQSATNQRTVNFAGGALPRLGALDDQLSKLPNADVNAINKVMSVVSKQFGKPEYTNYESNRNAIVQEIGTALSGTSQASDLRIKIELENLESAKSPAQIRGAISNLREALIARLDVDLSPLYPIEVVRGEKSMERFKKDMFAKFRGKYGPGNADMSSYTVNGKVYNIPAEKESAFLKAYPNAKRTQ